MQIVRGDKTFTLTRQEILDAHKEYIENDKLSALKENPSWFLDKSELDRLHADGGDSFYQFLIQAEIYYDMLYYNKNGRMEKSIHDALKVVTNKPLLPSQVQSILEKPYVKDLIKAGTTSDIFGCYGLEILVHPLKDGTVSFIITDNGIANETCVKCTKDGLQNCPMLYKEIADTWNKRIESMRYDNEYMAIQKASSLAHPPFLYMEPDPLRKDLLYWSNSMGELHKHGKHDIEEHELPTELQKAYQSLWSDSYKLLCYLVEYKGKYGIALSASYMEGTLFSTAVMDAVHVKRCPEFRDIQVLVGKNANADDHELIVIFPADTDPEKFKEAAMKLEQILF